MKDTLQIKQFWREYCTTQPNVEACLAEPYDSWDFGDSPDMADELGQLAIDGVKTATAGLVWEAEYFGWMMPAAGVKSVLLDSSGCPMGIVETTEVEIKPFDQVSDAFAILEGEGFKDAEDWAEAHWRYFGRRCEEIGRQPTRQMPVICEKFKVVYRRSNS